MSIVSVDAMDSGEKMRLERQSLSDTFHFIIEFSMQMKGTRMESTNLVQISGVH